jgi:hypothetical protein
MHDHLYSYDKIYKYEIVVEPIPNSTKYKGYVYLDLYEKAVYISGEFSDPEALRDLLITNVTNYLDNFGAIPIDK